MNNIKKFENFLESLKGKGQDNLIESVKKGFQTCMEGKQYEYPQSTNTDDKEFDKFIKPKKPKKPAKIKDFKIETPKKTKIGKEEYILEAGEEEVVEAIDQGGLSHAFEHEEYSEFLQCTLKFKLDLDIKKIKEDPNDEDQDIYLIQNSSLVTRMSMGGDSHEMSRIQRSEDTQLTREKLMQYGKKKTLIMGTNIHAQIEQCGNSLMDAFKTHGWTIDD